MTATLFALFAEVERDLISERTREGLARSRAAGRKLGRPKRSLGVSRLDGREDEIRRFLTRMDADLGESRPGMMPGRDCTGSATTRGSAGPAAGRAAPRLGSGQRPSSSKLRR